MTSDSEQKIASAFARAGWIGFWIQAVLLLLPIVALVYVLSSTLGESSRSRRFVDYLAFADLALMVFTAFWSYRYTRLARRIVGPAPQPSWRSVARSIWIGLSAALVGMTISIVLMMIAVGRLLFLLLKAPQGGVPVIQTAADDRGSWVSTINVVSLLAELCTVAGEVLLLGLSLWLLHRLTSMLGCFNESEPNPAEAIAPIAE